MKTNGFTHWRDAASATALIHSPGYVKKHTGSLTGAAVLLSFFVSPMPSKSVPTFRAVRNLAGFKYGSMSPMPSKLMPSVRLVRNLTGRGFGVTRVESMSASSGAVLRLLELLELLSGS